MKLFESSNYILESEYEVVLLRHKKSNNRIIVGDHYGDPTCGYINSNESYCISCGEGVIIYKINSKNIPYRRDVSDDTWIEFFRDSLDIESIAFDGESLKFYDESRNLLDLAVSTDWK